MFLGTLGREQHFYDPDNQTAMKVMVTISLIKAMAKASTLSNKTLGIQSSVKL